MGRRSCAPPRTSEPAVKNAADDWTFDGLLRLIQPFGDAFVHSIVRQHATRTPPNPAAVAALRERWPDDPALPDLSTPAGRFAAIGLTPGATADAVPAGRVVEVTHAVCEAEGKRRGSYPPEFVVGLVCRMIESHRDEIGATFAIPRIVPTPPRLIRALVMLFATHAKYRMSCDALGWTGERAVLHALLPFYGTNGQNPASHITWAVDGLCAAHGLQRAELTADLTSRWMREWEAEHGLKLQA